jgi:MATE family multidrug resistance protein
VGAIWPNLEPADCVHAKPAGASHLGRLALAGAIGARAIEGWIGAMRRIWRGFRVELWPTLSLAWPVVAAELGWMGMGIVDTIFVGRLGAEAIGAVSIGSMVYFAVAIFGIGLLLGLDTLVAQAFGAGRRHECHRWLVQGVYLCLILTPMVMGFLWASIPWLGRLGLPPAVLEQAIPFLRTQIGSTLPLLLYSAVRRYLQAMGLVKPVMFALISANVVNAVGDWILIYGHWGAPALGVLGSGWATAIARTYMASVLIGFALIDDLRHRTGLLRVSLRPRLVQLGRLIALGLPAAVHVTLEVGVFAAATTLAGMLDPVALAAHHVVLDIASVTFMIPLGLSSAGAVRVGQALGRGEPAAAGHAGWTALTLGAGFMACAGVVFASVPRILVSVFTTDPAVIATAGSLMLVAAAFQLFDGLQGVSTGAMRGTGDTQTPMVCNLVAHWCVGLPLGYLLGFGAGFGVIGLWAGLALGLAAAGVYLLAAWTRKARALARGEYALLSVVRGP